MKIVSIEETRFSNRPDPQYPAYNDRYEGYVLTMDNGDTIKLGISSGQSCCEEFGYLMSEDDLQSFVGSEYIGTDVVDQSFAVREALGGINIDACMFVNINTSKGLLQFVAYNEHNGYYGHDAVMIFNDVVAHEETL